LSERRLTAGFQLQAADVSDVTVRNPDRNMGATAHAHHCAMLSWLQSGSQIAAAFLGSSVEAVEAITLVLAASVARGWRPARGAGSEGIEP
jgi:hypothetical protein